MDDSARTTFQKLEQKTNHSMRPAPPLLAVGTVVKRAAVFASFVFTKQPARIRQVGCAWLH